MQRYKKVRAMIVKILKRLNIPEEEIEKFLRENKSYQKMKDYMTREEIKQKYLEQVRRLLESKSKSKINLNKTEENDDELSS